MKNLHALQPGFEFGRGAQAQHAAHIQRVVKRRSLVVQHDVVRAGNAHHKIAARHTQEREQHVHVVLVGLGMVGVADIATHRQAEQLAAKMVFQSGAGDLLGVKQILRPDEAHHGVDQQGFEMARHGIGAGLAGLLVQPVVRVGGERAALPGFKVHHVVAHGSTPQRERGTARLGQQGQVQAEAAVGGLGTADGLEHQIHRRALLDGLQGVGDMG